MHNYTSSESDLHLRNENMSIPKKTLIQLPTRQEMERMQSNDKINV